MNTDSYPSCEFSWEEQRDFVKAVKAEFERNNIKTKIWILVHNFDMAMNYAGEILKDREAYQATDGIAFHDYEGEPEAMTELHNAYPEKDILLTERSVWGTKGTDRIIRYFRNWACTYNSWVTILDGNRKPNSGFHIPDPTTL